MPSIHSIPFKQLKNPSALLALIRNSKPPNESNTTSSRSSKRSSSNGGILKMFKLFPLLTSGCKVVALLAGGSRHRRPLISDHATIVTLFGHRRGRIILAVHQDAHSMPFFVIELPILSSAFHKEMSCDSLRVALETETKSYKKKLTEEYMWGVYCNGRKVGYSIRRVQLSDDEVHVMQMLRGVSMGAGVLHEYDHEKRKEKGIEKSCDDQVTYFRARFERVVGSKDSEALYMINPDNSEGPELSIFFVRVH